MAACNYYNAPDGSFVKAVKRQGTGAYTPTEASQCNLIISVVSQEELNRLNFDLVTGEETQLIIGEGDSDVRDIVDKCVMSMRQGEVAGLLFPVLDGQVVKGADAQNGTFVTLEITLMSFTRECLWQFDSRRKLQFVQGHKDRGSELFKRGVKEAAFRRYSRAMKYLISMGSIKDIPSDLQQDCIQLRTQLYLNLAACQMHFDNYDGVVGNCSKALIDDSNNVKGLYRRGVAYSRQQDWENAGADLRAVVNLENGNKAALRELQTVQQMLYEQKEQEKLGQLAKGMRQMFS